MRWYRRLTDIFSYYSHVRNFKNMALLSTSLLVVVMFWKCGTPLLSLV